MIEFSKEWIEHWRRLAATEKVFERDEEGHIIPAYVLAVALEKCLGRIEELEPLEAKYNQLVTEHNAAVEALDKKIGVLGKALDIAAQEYVYDACGGVCPNEYSDGEYQNGCETCSRPANTMNSCWKNFIIAEAERQIEEETAW